VSGHAKMPPASNQVSATSLKLLIQQIHPHVREESESLLDTRRSHPGLNGDPSLCDFLYTAGGVGELYQR
jgi:hypothetical protein